MPINYPAPSEGVNPQPHPQPQPKPSYWAVIPATVRYCKSVPPAAKLLFGEITALCSVEGFCWASNAYFEALYEVDRSTLKRWLAALAKEGFIRVDLVHGTGERRIYDLTINPPTPAQKCAPPSAKVSRPPRKNAPQSITKNNTKSKTETLNVVGGPPPRFVGPGPVPAREVQNPEGKGPAAPAAVDAASPLPWGETKINAVVAVTCDDASRKRFRQLLDVCEGAGCLEVWDDALDALERALGASTGRVERRGAYFCGVLVKLLNERGVSVPVGKPSERRAVKSSIAASFAAADLAGVDLLPVSLGAGEGLR